jgi:hypothetical protein
MKGAAADEILPRLAQGHMALDDVDYIDPMQQLLFEIVRDHAPAPPADTSSSCRSPWCSTIGASGAAQRKL